MNSTSKKSLVRLSSCGLKTKLPRILKMKQRLEKAKENKEKVKILFEYPNSKSVKVRRGFVKKINETSFDFQEDKDGLVTYSFKHIVEIKKEWEKEK